MASLIESSPSPAPTLGDREGRPHLVLVEWVDIISDSSWTPPDEVECPEFKTIGWLAYEDMRCIKVADTLDEEGKLWGVTAFPKGAVLKVTYLKK